MEDPLDSKSLNQLILAKTKIADQNILKEILKT